MFSCRNQEACQCSSNEIKKAYYRDVPCFSEDILKRIPIIDLRRSTEENVEMHYTSTYKRDYKPPGLFRKKNSMSECCFTKKYYERVLMP